MNTRKSFKPVAPNENVGKENVKPQRALEKMRALTKESTEAQTLYEEQIYQLETSQEYAKTTIKTQLKANLDARLDQLLHNPIVLDDNFNPGETKKKANEVGAQIRKIKKEAKDVEKIDRELSKVINDKKRANKQLVEKSAQLGLFIGQMDV